VNCRDSVCGIMWVMRAFCYFGVSLVGGALIKGESQRLTAVQSRSRGQKVFSLLSL
jgi:hypothetical protein